MTWGRAPIRSRSPKPKTKAHIEVCRNRATAYNRDHDRNIGAATFTAPLGKGTVLFQAVRGMKPVVYERFITNSLVFLKGKATVSNQTTVAPTD